MNLAATCFKNRFSVFAFLFVLAVFIIEKINDRFWLNDFKVYYDACVAFFNGAPVYGTLFALDLGYFKYSPFTAMLTMPYTIFPFEIARIIHFVVISFSVLCVFNLSGSIINKTFFNGEIQNISIWLGLAFLACANHMVRELHLGNINVILLLLLMLFAKFFLEKKFILSGIIFSLAIMAKPFFIIMLLPVVLRKNFKVLYSVIATSGLFILIPALVSGFHSNLVMHLDWIKTMLHHYSFFPGNHTIEFLLVNYFKIQTGPSFLFLLVCLLISANIIFYFIKKKSSGKSGSVNSMFLMEWFTWIALMPSIFKTDSQHFLLSAPLIIFSIFYLSKKKDYFLSTIFIMIVLMFGSNSSDLLGKYLSARYDSYGILGISNPLIILFAWIVYLKGFLKNQRNNASSFPG